MTPLLIFAAVAQFTGSWVFEADGRAALILTVDAKGATMVRPERFNIDSEGEIVEIGGKIAEKPLKFGKKRGELRSGSDIFRLEPVDPDHLDLAPSEMPWAPIRLRRVQPSEHIAIPATWPEPNYAPEIVELQNQIKSMVEVDQKVRLSDKARAATMEEVDLLHRPEVERIFERYGWPKRSIVGKHTAHQFWLLVQHQPLELQQRMLPEMEVAVKQGEASRSDYAYLYDRVQTSQNKPQRWGTQAKCVNGLPVLFPIEEQAGLEDRRRELRMPPIAVYLRHMREMCRAMR